MKVPEQVTTCPLCRTKLEDILENQSLSRSNRLQSLAQTYKGMHQEKLGGVSDLLEDLREGNLRSYIRINEISELPLPIPKAEWKKINPRKFKIRRTEHKGRITYVNFNIDHNFVVAPEINNLKDFLVSFIKNGKLIPGTLPPSLDINESTNEREAITAIIKHINLFESILPGKSRVYCNAADVNEFYSILRNRKKKKAGTNALPSDQAWVELINLFTPQKPVAQKILIRDWFDACKERNTPMTDAWLKQRATQLYKRMGWSNAD